MKVGDKLYCKKNLNIYNQPLFVYGVYYDILSVHTSGDGCLNINVNSDTSNWWFNNKKYYDDVS